MKTPLLTLAPASLAVAMLATPALAMAPTPQGIPQGNRATMALNALESKGYVDFSHFRPDGQSFAAQVTRDGRMMHVLVAPETGTITASPGATPARGRTLKLSLVRTNPANQGVYKVGQGA